MRRSLRCSSLVALAALLAAPTLHAVEQPVPVGAELLLFEQPELAVSELNFPAAQVPDAGARARLDQLRLSPQQAQFDLRTGRFATLMPATPLLPGSGVGNHLSWSALGRRQPATTVELQARAWEAFAGWVKAHRDALGLDPTELASPGRVTVLSADYVQIYSPRVVDSIPVRGAYVTATIKHGNLILFGASRWGDLQGLAVAEISEVEAADSLARRAAPFELGARWKASELAWVPVSTAASLTAAEIGSGLDHRLVWVLHPTFGEPQGRYEALVDARNGDVLAISDTVQHAATTRLVAGGAYPVSNDGVAPDGVEVAGTPLSFSTVTTPAGIVTTDIGGNLPACVDGSISAGLSGQYVTMTDTCGTASLAATGNLDFGTSSGTDCTTPGLGGSGNTHASRSGYAELNQIKAMARGQLPANSWLTQQLTANMNIVSTCNAGWDGATVNFFRSGGGCNNTGELAGVFDHEWGHGMDNNDAVPTVSSPGEGIADLYASLRLDTSCIGRNFRATACSGYGNPCTTCTGVRDIDWDKHTAHTPFGMANADACGPGNTNGPCGGSVHCEGQIYSQSVWDLWNRDLLGGGFNLSLDAAREVATQLTYRGAGGVGSWFACSPGTGGCGNPNGCGCGATSGYQQYLAADDDNGSLADGTPHMQALFDAFSRHGIACTTPTVTTAGCAGTPTQVPVVTATGEDRGVALAWTASAGATAYRVYRTDSVFACSFGKQLIATVSGTSFDDTGLRNGHAYHYQVVPMGATDECFAVASTCATGTPTAGANLAAVPALASVAALTGDGDPFVDNCETARVSLPISNIGTATQTNLRIVGVSSPSHPTTTFLTSFPALVAATFATCDTANATFDFIATGLDPGETLTFEVELATEELGLESRFATVSFTTVEGDLQTFASKTFSFDSDSEGWTTTEGTFVRDSSGGGANSTPFYLRSSTFLDNQCDAVRSPLIRLHTDSTMTLFNNYNIENFSGGQWWDRANIGIRPLGSSSRTVVSPSSGRTYNASGTGGTCGTEGQAGWANANATWGSASWTAAALQSPTFANQLVQLEVRYGTDGSVNNFGFRFDELTLTNVDVQVADSASNVCTSNLIFADGFETGNTSAWSLTFP